MNFKLMLSAVALSFLFTGSASAQFNRVGTVGSAELSYLQINAPNTSSWQGAELAVLVPVAKTGSVSWNADAQMQMIQTHGGTASGQNIATVGVGVTPWMNFNMGKVALLPYMRLGVQGNTGNFSAVNNHYTSYQVEPGVVAKIGNFYGLAAYQYGQGFNSEYGSVVNMPKVGLGVNVTKNLALEARYEMNRGSYDFDRTVAGIVYKF